MDEILFKTSVVKLGANSLDFLGEKMIILFNKRVQDQLAEYSVLIDDAEGIGNIEVGCNLCLGQTKYKVTALGEVAIKNLMNLGHAVLKFDGKDTADLPGNIHLENKEILQIHPGIDLLFTK